MTRLFLMRLYVCLEIPVTWLREELPCRLCLHVFVLVGLERFSHLWGYAVRHACLTGSKWDSRLRDTGVYAVCGKSRFASRKHLKHQTWLCTRASDGVTPKEDPTSLKKAKLEWAKGRGPIPGQLSARVAGTVPTRYRWPCTRGNWRRSLRLSSAPLWVGGVIRLFSPLGHQNKREELPNRDVLCLIGNNPVVAAATRSCCRIFLMMIFNSLFRIIGTAAVFAFCEH